jgi:hypothetical protein
MAVRVRRFPKLPPLEENGCGPSTLMSAGVEREGIAAFDAVPLEGFQEELRHPAAPKPRQFALGFNAGIAHNVSKWCGMDLKPR